MVEWTNQLPSSDDRQSLPIRRTPGTKTLKAIVTSEDMIGTFTHYYRGRTSPCERPDCEACNSGMPYRYHAYVGCWDPMSNLHFILEVTAQAAEHLVKHRTQHTTLRGCEISAYRWGKRSNGRVILRCTKSVVPVTSLPAPPDLKKCLSVLWNLPLEKLEVGERVKGSPKLSVSEQAVKDLADRSAP